MEIFAKVDWVGMLPSKGKEDELMKEEVHIIYNAERDDAIELTFNISLTPLHWGTKLGGSDDVKGYGGFSARVILPDDIKFSGKSGSITPQNTAVEAGNWVKMNGTFSPTHTEQSVITLMNDPANPTPFIGWILRKSKSMQNPAWPGRNSIFLPKGETQLLRYRILIHEDIWTNGMIEQNFRNFVGERP